MENIPAIDPRRCAQMSAAELRGAFLREELFQPGQLSLCHWETDRAVFGGAVPTGGELTLAAANEMRSAYFCERRELGIINTGAAGSVTVDGQRHELAPLDMLYVGRGAQGVAFASHDPQRPACFFLLSYPAHTAWPTTLVRHDPANAVVLGAPAFANHRHLTKVIHPGGIRSCQLVMGFTMLQPGSVWNTMPPHTHARRSELYMYFQVPPGAAVMHLMGRPDETRHLVVRDHQVVLSPPWSIHCGAGTASYAFVWGMGGENQDFADMDPAPLDQLR